MEQRNALGPPRPGYFKLRAFSRGPWVPAEIRERLPIDPDTAEVLDRSPTLEAFIDDQPVETERVWTWGREIERDEWEWTRALWAIEKIKPSIQRQRWRHRQSTTA